jgi:hypothetical protein
MQHSHKGSNKSSHHASNPQSKGGHPLHAAIHPSEGYAPARCDNGWDHNPLGFKEEMAEAHAIRRGSRG